ncbi:MAG: hypothetical protein JW852_05345 [Spirochaetales bacterium]|nr:hypothetical protein [Spirochaetales bacterium]
MILLKRSTAVVFCVLFTAFILGTGVYAYLELSGDNAVSSSQLKAKAESVLYIAVTGAMVVLVAFLAVAWRTLSLYRELDKLIELNKRGDFSPELSMKKLGPIGERITLLYFSLNALNERKTLKISALSELVDFLMHNIQAPLLVTDVQGYIRYIGENAAGQTDHNRSELIGRNVETVFPEVPFRDSVLELDRRKTSVELNELKNPLTLAAIRDRRNELAYVVLLFGGAIHIPQRPSQGAKSRSRPDRRKGVFRRRSG